jgi:hypothetical protein
MAQTNPRLLVQSMSSGLRGQILLAFLFAGKAMDVYELAEWTGRPRNAHGPHLRALCGVGLLAKSSKRMAHGREIFLLGSEVLPLMQDLTAKLTAGKYIEEADADAQVSDFQTPRELPAIEAVVRTTEDLEALTNALAKYWITGPTKNKLLACEWVSAEYVHAVVEFKKADSGDPRKAVGGAITAMLDHVPQPARRANGHIENCQCSTCKLDEALGRTGYICAECNQYPCACDEETEGE